MSDKKMRFIGVRITEDELVALDELVAVKTLKAEIEANRSSILRSFIRAGYRKQHKQKPTLFNTTRTA